MASPMFPEPVCSDQERMGLVRIAEVREASMRSHWQDIVRSHAISIARQMSEILGEPATLLGDPYGRGDWRLFRVCMRGRQVLTIMTHMDYYRPSDPVHGKGPHVMTTSVPSEASGGWLKNDDLYHFGVGGIRLPSDEMQVLARRVFDQFVPVTPGVETRAP